LDGAEGQACAREAVTMAAQPDALVDPTKGIACILALGYGECRQRERSSGARRPCALQKPRRETIAINKSPKDARRASVILYAVPQAKGTGGQWVISIIVEAEVSNLGCCEKARGIRERKGNGCLAAASVSRVPMSLRLTEGDENRGRRWTQLKRFRSQQEQSRRDGRK